MARDRKCILCETVHNSKQEMDEHMRSMLHHRELEKLKGRDCGHECRVCKVTVGSLTDYAGHISSPSHKQNVEAAEQKHAGNERDEDYFDQVLVDLIEKRKEQIRKEKEAAAAKLAKEDADRKRKEEFQQRLKQAKDRYQWDCGWQQPAQDFDGYRSNRYNPRGGEIRPWHHSRQGKSATWHAQEPPNFQRWGSGDISGGSLNGHEGWGGRPWDQGPFNGNPRSRLPWLSSGGSSNGVYGRNNIAQPPRRDRPSIMGHNPMYPPPPCFFAQALGQFPKTGNDQGGQQREGLQGGEGQTLEPDHGTKTPKTFGSNPKLDKACRWSPYSLTKGVESTTPNSKVSKPQKPDKPAEAFKRQSRPELTPGQVNSSVEEQAEQKTKPRDRSSSGSRSSSAQRDTAPAPSNQRPNKMSKDQKVAIMLGASGEAQLRKAVNQPQSKSTAAKAPPNGSLQPRKERQLPEMLRKARQMVLEKRSSLDSSINNRMEVTLHIMEEQQRDHVQSQAGINKENRQNAAKPNAPVKPAPPSSDSSHFLQSLQVSTSSLDPPEPPAPSKEDEESRKAEDGPGEASHSSESDTSAQPASNASQLSKLDLPPVLRRDLTKHISSKSKTGSHEPNLNIARRVRNLSESRRSDTEKDSGLKPTVRQLISSSGSRRSVNWEQVYQEVRKKQDKGKGMPRFGIEMVPLDQEDQSQEEDNIPLLEGFHWDSLTDTSASGASRKRSLSESSVAPAPSHSLFKSLMSKEASQRGGGGGSEQQGATVSPTGSKDDQQEVEKMLGQSEAKAQKQPDKLTLATAKVLQRSDSALGDSSLGTEQCDGHGTAKRRRAAGDVQSAEMSCLEHNSKRRKVKSKKERLQIDQLLTVSLREEELSRSLQTVDTSLIQARAALQAAYMEVQRLMVVKEQITGEMSTLRNKRIDLLKGMQGRREETPQVKLKEERLDSVEAEPHASAPSPSVAVCTLTDSAPGPPAERASPPSSSLAFTPVVIKQEPQSPVHVSSEPQPEDNCAHSTTPELLAAPPAASPTGARGSPADPELHVQPSLTEGKSDLFPTGPDHREPADRKESLTEQVETMEKSVQASRSCLSPPSDSKAHIKLLSAVDCAAPPAFETPAVPSLTASPCDPRSGKRVRKLKKRKVLKKAQGAEQPESSDTELDGEALRPRWLRPRRRPSGSSQVSTSTQPSEDRDAEVNMEVGEEAAQETPERSTETPPAELRLNLDAEESMEVSAPGQQPHEDVRPAAPPTPPAQLPDSSRPEPQSLACNEVSSTSDMDICRSSESDYPFPVALPKITKNSSDASSDHGDDNLPTEGAFEGHQEAVNAMQIHDGLLYTCSGDRTVRAFDLVSHKCVAVFEGHSSKVSCLLVSAAPGLHHRLYSGSSDQTVRCYSLKTRELEQQFSLSDRVLCLHARWKVLYAGLANGTVVTFNLKTNKQMDVFECHGPRAVSCLASSQEGARRILLVGSYDSTISVRDAKNGLLLRTLEGHTKTVLCMKVVNDLVFSGSSDQCVYAHNIHTGEPVRVYKGHSHAVTVVSVLGKVMVTACLDKLVRVYDLQSHDQLQVYGGHKDMVMCMTIHKNMIFTGCYDGSVEAVKLNLMQNYRCWWHGCSLVFGMTEHLQQHLINDHASPNVQTLRCRWKDCEEFFCARNSPKQGMLVHMRKHTEEEVVLEP